MHEEPADKLMGIEGHELDFVVVFIIPLLEGNPAILNFNNPVVGDGNPVGILAEVLKDLLRPGKGRFAVKEV